MQLTDRQIVVVCVFCEKLLHCVYTGGTIRVSENMLHTMPPYVFFLLSAICFYMIYRVVGQNVFTVTGVVVSVITCKMVKCWSRFYLCFASCAYKTSDN